MSANTENSTNLAQGPDRILKNVYLERKDRNSSYSLTSFARDLGISKSFLSRIFSGSRPLSFKFAMQISVALNLSESESRAFLLTVVQHSTKNAKISKQVRSRLEQDQLKDSQSNKVEGINYTTIEIENFKVIASWYHIAILNLVKIKTFKSKPSWIAKQLGITTTEASEAVDRLISLGLITEEEEILKSLPTAINIKTKKSEFAVRKFHGQMIDKAKDELKKVGPDDFNSRLINGITFTCAKSQIELLKEKIDKFQDEILSLTATSEKEEVYQMNIQFFPLTKNTEN